MKPNEPINDWEKALHRELDALPELEAPASLIPGVLAMLQQKQMMPWYRHPFWGWPPVLRIAVLLLMSGTVGVLFLAIPHTWDTIITPAFAACLAKVAAWWEPLGSTGSLLVNASTAFWQKHLQQILPGIALLMASIYFTFVAAGTAIYRLAWRRTL